MKFDSKEQLIRQSKPSQPPRRVLFPSFDVDTRTPEQRADARDQFKMLLEVELDDTLIRHACPKCEGYVQRSFTCHTHQSRLSNGKDIWVSCLTCDSAVQYACEADGCDWYYVNGLNPKNPRAADNELRRPQWMPLPENDPWLQELPEAF